VKPGAKGGARTLILAWSPPTSAGASAVTGCEVTVHKVKGARLVVAVAHCPRGEQAEAPRHARGEQLPRRRAVGWSVPSATSNAVTPR
jgi:hypothetical protein